MNKRTTIYVFISCALLGALFALAYFFLFQKNTAAGNSNITIVRPVADDGTNEKEDNTVRPNPMQIPNPTVDLTPSQLMAKYGLSRVQEDPQSFAKAIARIVESANVDMLDFMKSSNIINEEIAEQLKQMITEGKLELDPNNPVTEIGEISRNKKVRISINLKDGRRIYMDIEKNDDGKWSINKLKPSNATNKDTPENLADLTDALSVVDTFIQSAINLNFGEAKKLVDPERVPDATIAGICILFEEGLYKLRKNQPLRNMFSNENKAGFLAYIQADGSPASNIGLTVEKNKENLWTISDLALDSLLQDYANKFSDGDGLFVPIVKNPKGGDSLVLYFAFDEAALAPRSVRQLQIVANILKLDPAKKIEISGHTDDLGTDEYNQKLSEKRAESVKSALITAGLKPEQIVTTGFGKKHQRKTIDPTDTNDPDVIRRINRRAEIYLDF